MNIVLIGYGKMGKTIESILLQRGHTVILAIDVENQQDFTKENITKADVAIEFTSPHSAYDNVMKLLSFNIPVVCGSTGWLQKFDEVKKYCEKQNGTLLYASNFSVGVNIFFEINKRLAALMSKHPEYNVGLKEVHHTQKKDAPSGTAVTLAEGVLQHFTNKQKWVNEVTSKVNELSIISERIDPAPGTHHVLYSSPIDDIEIIHTAHNRTGFATGAVLAAEYIYNKKGLYTMNDVLGL